MRATVALLTFLFLLLTSTAGCKQATLHKDRVQWTPKVSEWVMDPLVMVCRTAPVTHQQVQHSLDLWAEHGAPQLKAFPSHCFNTDGEHAVYIDLPTQWDLKEFFGPSTVGATVTYSREEDGPVSLGTTFLMTDDMRTLTHEIGHLWFTEHSPPGSDHVLAEWIEHFDWDHWEGVQRAFKASR